MNANLLLAGLQLLVWLFFQPSSWRAYLQQIDPALRPQFCLAQLTDIHWQHPLMRRLLMHGYLVLPILTMLITGFGLTIFGRITLLSMTGYLLGIGMGILLGTAVSTAAGIIAAIVGGTAFAVAWSGPSMVWFDLVATPRFGFIYGLIYAGIAYTLLNIAEQRKPAPLGRQTGNFVIAFLGSIVMTAIIIGVASFTFSIGERGALVNRSVGLIGASITGGLFGLAVGWRTSSLRRGSTLGLLSAIMVFNLLGNAGNEYGHSLGGRLLIQNYSFVISLIFTLLFSLVYAFMERIAGTWPATIAGSFGIIPIHLLLGNFMLMYDTKLNIAVSLFLSFSGITASIWRPILFYPLEAALTTLLLRADEGRQSANSHLLHWNAGFWDEGQFLRLYGLDEHLVLQAERNPEEGKMAIEYVSRGRQRWAAQTAQIEIDARRLEACSSVEDIAGLSDLLVVGTLIRPDSDILRSFAIFSQDTSAALAQVGLYNLRLGLSAVSQSINNLQRELIRSTSLQAERFQPIAAQWQHLLDERIHDLVTLTESRQEIQNPYIVGVPLTRRQAIFVGRADISVRMEELMQAQDYPPLLLYGQRRMGKTSLLYQLRWLLPNHILPLVIDLQGPVSLASDHAGFLYAVAKQIHKSATSQGLLLPELTRASLTNDPFTIFDDWLDNVEGKMIEQSHTTILLALDEFEALNEALVIGKLDERAILGTLRHIVQHRSRFKLLLAGSHTLDEFQRWSSYLINAQMIHLSYLAESEARRLIERPIADFTLSYAPDASQRIIMLTRCHPYLIQLLCSEIVTLKNQQASELRRLVTVSNVEAAVPETLTLGSNFFADIERNQAGDPARQLLYFLARSERGAASMRELEREFNATIDINAALHLLVRREVLEPVDGEYRFQVELVRRWFARDIQ